MLSTSANSTSVNSSSPLHNQHHHHHNLISSRDSVVTDIFNANSRIKKKKGTKLRYLLDESTSLDTLHHKALPVIFLVILSILQTFYFIKN